MLSNFSGHDKEIKKSVTVSIVLCNLSDLEGHKKEIKDQ